MAAEREAEAVRACAVLGVAPGAVTFARLPGAYLHQHQAAARHEVAALWAELRPGTTLVTMPGDGHQDHEVASEAVLAAVPPGFDGDILGYPTWAWRHWPWVPGAVRPPWRPRPDPRRDPALAARPIGRAFGGTRLLAELNVRIDVSRALQTKRRALDCYRSQVERRADVPGWQVLDDAGGGEFVPRFFTGWEFFRRLR
jgi:LmbE family N-acetylglucosaminyl deacetylase